MCKKVLCVLLVLAFMLSMGIPVYAAELTEVSSMDDVVFKSAVLPEWFPESAPEPDPNGEIVTVYWYIDENGNAILYNPNERVTVIGDAGSATIYWVNSSQVAWGVTSNSGGIMVFSGVITTSNGQFFNLGDIEFDGDCGGNIYGVYTVSGRNTATLSGIMIDANGISITAPEVTSNYYR